MLRTLIYFWRTHLAVIAGAAVAAAVLTGALLVGDSVRGSLRDLTLDRLGGIDHALAAQQFFGDGVATRLAAHPQFTNRFRSIAPVILLAASAQHADTRRRAADVGLQGIDQRFLEVFGESADLFREVPQEAIFLPVVVNTALAEELGAEIGDDIVLALKRWSAIPRGSLLGRKDTDDVVKRLRLSVVRILPDRGLGRFSLATHQGTPKVAFVPLASLQDELDQEGTVNGLVVAGRTSDSKGAASELDRLLADSLEPEDLGWKLTARDGWLAIESEEFILKPSLVAAIESVARDAGARQLPILTYLANGIATDGNAIPYATVTALDTTDADLAGGLRLTDGSPAPALGADEILLNDWTAEELGAEVGEPLELTYFAVGPREELTEESTSLRLRGVVSLTGLAADGELSQEYPGIADAENMADWDPPFPIDLGKVRAADEEYWDLHRATPRAFVRLQTGQQLWRTRWGELTAMRVAPGPGGELTDLVDRFRRELPAAAPLEAFGMSFQPVKSLGLGASGGTTDFGGLFIGMSQFLIVSAALLVALLFRLGVEQRASEIGLRLAVGYPPGRVKRRLLAEGGVLAVIGSLIGLVGAIAFAALMMAGLRTWWQGAVGTSSLFLHVTPKSLAMGFLIAVGVVLFAIWRTVSRIGRLEVTALLSRSVEPHDTRAGQRARWTAGTAFSLAIGLLFFVFASGRASDPTIFFLLGPTLLIGLLAVFSLAIGRSTFALSTAAGPATLVLLALGNSGRHRGRSLLSTTLVACASFLIVAVAAFHQDLTSDASERSSGTGGYTLVAESDVPLYHDLASPDGRFDLALNDDEALLEAADIVPFRLLPGDDTSCLNLYQPGRPRLLGVPTEHRRRGGFRFAQTLRDTDDPWSLLEEQIEPGIIPAIGDLNSTQWILKLGLGEDLIMEDESGEELRLRLVANLETSIFQSELLISEESFRRHFPSHSGYSYFLIEASPEHAQETSLALESRLDSYGFDVVSAATKLAAFHTVQNTYLSTFQTLGGLGLLLGTVGLAVLLARNVIERRSELAALRAFGFRRRSLTTMVVLENALLLLAGLAIGTLSALVAVAPNLIRHLEVVPWMSILGTLFVILTFGLMACIATASVAMRAPILPTLKAET